MQNNSSLPLQTKSLAQPSPTSDKMNFIDKISFLQKILKEEENDMKRIQDTQDSLLKNSAPPSEELKTNQQRHSFISNSDRRISAPLMRKVPPLRSPLFVRSDTDEAAVSDNDLKARALPSHISIISPKQPKPIQLPRWTSFKKKSLSISGSPAIVLRTPGPRGKLRSSRTQQLMPLQMESEQRLTSMKTTPKSSANRKDKLRQIQHNLFHLLQELDDTQSDTSGRSSPTLKKKQVKMVDQEIQTERKQRPEEKKCQKKKKSRRTESGVMGVVAGGAVAGAVLGGIFLAVKLFSRPNK